MAGRYFHGLGCECTPGQGCECDGQPKAQIGALTIPKSKGDLLWLVFGLGGVAFIIHRIRRESAAEEIV